MVLDKNSQKIIDQEAEKALWEKLAYYSIAVIGKEHGTGIPITYKDKYFIITCAHVIKGLAQDKLRFAFRTEDPLVNKKKEEFAEGMRDTKFRFNEMEELSIKTIHLASSSFIDLAAIELNGPIKGKVFEFFPLSKNNIKEPLDKLQVCLMGFAGEIAKPFEDKKAHKKGHILFLFEEQTEIVDNAAPLDNFYTEHHFFMRFYDDYNPEGMSGCGIWSLEKSKDLIWHIAPKLIGIQSAYYRKSKLLKGEKVDRLFELLDMATNN